MSFLQASPLEVVTTGLGYPESPKPMPDGSVLLVEIRKKQLTRVTPDGEQHAVASFEGGPNGLALGPDGHAWVANNGGFDWLDVPLPNGQKLSIGTTQPDNYTGGLVQRVELDTGTVTTAFSHCSKGMNMQGFGNRKPVPVAFPEPLGLRGPDDLVFDRSGGCWISDWGKQRPRDADVTGIYYAPAGSGELIEMIFPLASPNGIALSPAEDRLYAALTYSRQVVYWKLGKQPGEIIPNPDSMDGSYLLNAKLPGQAILDSMCVDEDGNIYVAVMLPEGNTPVSNGGIAILSSDGKSSDFLPLDVPGQFSPLPSSMGFGGPDRKTLFITCGASGLLLKCRMHVAGHKLNFHPYA
jgi:gluconolactonase